MVDDLNKESIIKESDGNRLIDNNLNDPFFMSEGIVNKANEQKDTVAEFNTKGKNISLDEKYNIKFTIGADIFSNIALFMADINLDVIFRIRKDVLRLYTVDIAATHRAHVELKKTEFAEYNLTDLLDGDIEEYALYVDISIMNSVLVSKDYPLDIYIDTKEKMRMYFICGNDVTWVRLKSMSEKDIVLSTYANEEKSLRMLSSEEGLQKCIVSYSGMIKTLSSMSKKVPTDKNSSGIVCLEARKDRFGYVSETEIKGGKHWCMGDDVVVYPFEDSLVYIRLEYINVYSKLKLDNQVMILINKNLPVIFETRIGGGGIKIWYVIAPYLGDDD